MAQQRKATADVQSLPQRPYDPYPRSGTFPAVHKSMTAIKQDEHYLTTAVCKVTSAVESGKLLAQIQQDIAASFAEQDGYIGTDTEVIPRSSNGEHQLVVQIRWDTKERAERGTALVNAWFSDHAARLGVLNYAVTLVRTTTNWL